MQLETKQRFKKGRWGQHTLLVGAVPFQVTLRLLLWNDPESPRGPKLPQNCIVAWATL